MAQQRAPSVLRSKSSTGVVRPGTSNCATSTERSQPTRDEDRRADPKTKEAESLPEGHEQQRVASDVREYVRRSRGRTTAKVNERCELKLVFRS